MSVGTLVLCLYYGHVDVLREKRWPAGLTALLEDVRWNQVRWVSWDGHVDPESLRTSVATPQGDPFGPFALNLWIAGRPLEGRKSSSRVGKKPHHNPKKE